jgi:hypothetical protein
VSDEEEKFLPIVTNLKWQRFRFELLPDTLVSRLLQDHAARHGARTLLDGSKASDAPSQGFPKALECYLHLTNSGPLRPSCLEDGQLSALFPGFVGAVYSKRLFSDEVSLQARYNYVRSIYTTLAKMNAPLPEEIEALYPKIDRAPDAAQPFAEAFEVRPLDSNAVRIWRGWPITSATGARQWLPLRYVFEKFGPAWTDRLHQLLKLAALGLRQQRFPGLKELCCFIVERNDVNASTLQDRAFATQMWHDFWEFYRKARSPTASNRLIVENWRSHFRDFAQRVLISSGMFAAPYGSFPGPGHAPGLLRAKATKPTDESEVDGTLLASVPADISDEAAWNFLLVEIPAAVSRVRTWAENQVRENWALHLRRKRLAQSVKCGTWGLMEPGSECGGHLAAAAGTYEVFGHLTAGDANLRDWYPLPLIRTAQELGIPQALSLLPFAALLVIEHPRITSSLLESLEIWDKNGKLIGLQPQNGVTFLHGYKYRAGVQWAEVRIPLTPTSLRTVLKVLAITRPLREYLRAKGDDNWRFLLLTTRGFGQPKRAQKFAADTSESSRVRRVAAQMQKHCGLDGVDAGVLAGRLSLKSLRTTCGLKVFIETHSERRMAEALGHSEFNPQMLARYLPPPLLTFFRARWVRAFQTGLLSVILDNSEYKLRALGVSSSENLQRLLQGTNLGGIRDMLREEEPVDPGHDAEGRLVFNANRETLSLMRKFAAGTPNTGEEIFWHHFGKHVLGYMTSRVGMDPELDECLRLSEVS